MFQRRFAPTGAASCPGALTSTAQTKPIEGARPANPGAAPTAPPLFVQYMPAGLRVEEDWSGERRRQIALGIGLAALLLFAAAAHCVFAHSHGLLWIGLSRLSRVAADHGVPGAYLLAAVEHFLGAVGLAWLSLCLVAGASNRVSPHQGQKLAYHRRQMLQTLAPLFLGGGGLLVLGVVLATAGHQILAGLVEIPGWALFGTAAYKSLLPEARIAITCVGDANRGWSNHLLITGGPYNKGSLVIRHDTFESASVTAVGWQRVLRCADLRLTWRDPRHGERSVLIRGAGTPADLQRLVGYLYGSFTLSLDPGTIRGSRLQPFRPEQL